MKFQTRLLLANSLIVIALVSILGIMFYRNSANTLEYNAKTYISIISQRMSQQLDDIIRQMDFASLYIVSNQTFLTSANILATVDRQNPNHLMHVNRSRAAISGLLRSYAITSNFYSINMLSDDLEFQTSSFMRHSRVDVAEGMAYLPWLGDARNSHGRFLIVPPYIDPWSVDQDIRVFGLVRTLQGGRGRIGYLEVQNQFERLEMLFSLENLSDTGVMAIMSDGQFFYSSNPEVFDWSFYDDLAGNVSYNYAYTVSDYTGIKVIVVQEQATLLEPLHAIRTMTVTLYMVIATLSIGLVFIFSRRMARPLRNLMVTMEQTSVENLSDTFELSQSNDEIAALETVFAQMKERLADSIMKESEAQRLQIQAHFDSLQAQVNPHFINNILTVISSRGLKSGDLEICEICESISTMLRYSTSTRERHSTIEKEVNYAQTYLQLQKKRYEHKLEYAVDVDCAILSQDVPKIVIQQLVENAIVHGFKDIAGTMKIEIIGEHIKDWWYITVCDNGQGFLDEVLKDLYEKVEQLRESVQQLHAGFSIGGLGLLNTCARLSLFYGGKFAFDIKRENGQTKVRLGGIMRGVTNENSVS